MRRLGHICQKPSKRREILLLFLGRRPFLHRFDPSQRVRPLSRRRSYSPMFPPSASFCAPRPSSSAWRSKGEIPFGRGCWASWRVFWVCKNGSRSPNPAGLAAGVFWMLHSILQASLFADPIGRRHGSSRASFPRERLPRPHVAERHVGGGGPACFRHLPEAPGAKRRYDRCHR